MDSLGTGHMGYPYISYLCARDPSITKNYRLEHVKRNLLDDMEGDSSNSDDNKNNKHFQVYLRIKKTNNFNQLYKVHNGNILFCKALDEFQHNKNVHCANIENGKSYEFSKIFDHGSNQIDLFNDVIKEKILDFINGHNSNLLTYGVSGTGKTFTIVGTPNEPGIVPRALEYLFRTLPTLSEPPTIKPIGTGGIQQLSKDDCQKEKNIRQNLLKNIKTHLLRHIQTYRTMQEKLSSERGASIMGDIKNVTLSLWVSFAEIYNENVYDLLEMESSNAQNAQRQKLRLGYANGSTYIKDLTYVSVCSGLEAYQILQYGLQCLKFAKTTINDHSSRSHAIFTMRLAQASNIQEGISVSSFNFCDLAGVGSTKGFRNVSLRLQESNNINKSLLVLKRCLQIVNNSQKSNNKKTIPFRESKLTHLLQNAILRKEAISMIVNINTEKETYNETQHILNFAALAINNKQEQSLCDIPKFYNFKDKESNQETIEELKYEINELYKELEEHNFRFEEDHQAIKVTYEKMLEETNKTWQKNYDKLITLIRCKNKEVAQKKRKRSVVIINSSSSEEESDNEIKNLENQIEEMEEKITTQEDQLQILQSEIDSLQKTVTHSKADYINLTLEGDKLVQE